VHKFTVAGGVVGGMDYTFQVQAINFNGLGEASAPVQYTVCTTPGRLEPPLLAAATRTSMTLSWSPPLSDGGCPIQSYSIFMDDGEEGDLVEVDAADVNDKPTLRTYLISAFTASDTSKTYRFKLRASNSIGSVDSEEILHVLAAVPDKPTSGPTLNLAGTSTTSIRVDYAEFSTEMTGGAPVLSYELQIYDYDASTWTSLIGDPDHMTLTASYTQEEGIERGNTYMFRYRAWNVNGAGEYSDPSYLVAASPPARPPAPVYGSSTASSITLILRPSSDDGGKLITGTELEVSSYLATSWTSILSYDGRSTIHTLTTDDDPIEAYQKYRFRIHSTNEYGPSPSSPELTASIAPLPGEFDPVQKD